MVNTMDRLSSVSRSRCMGDDPDFVQYVYDCALAGVPVERVRESYRGERVYIPGRPRSNSEKASQIERDLRDKTALTPTRLRKSTQ